MDGRSKDRQQDLADPAGPAQPEPLSPPHLPDLPDLPPHPTIIRSAVTAKAHPAPEHLGSQRPIHRVFRDHPEHPGCRVRDGATSASEDGTGASTRPGSLGMSWTTATFRPREGPKPERSESRSAWSTRHTGSSQDGRVEPDPESGKTAAPTLKTGSSQDGRAELMLRIEPDRPHRPSDSTRHRPNLTPLAPISRVTTARTSTIKERPAAAATFPFHRDVDSSRGSIRSSKDVPL